MGSFGRQRGPQPLTSVDLLLPSRGHDLRCGPDWPLGLPFPRVALARCSFATQTAHRAGVIGPARQARSSCPAGAAPLPPAQRKQAIPPLQGLFSFVSTCTLQTRRSDKARTPDQVGKRRRLGRHDTVVFACPAALCTLQRPTSAPEKNQSR